MSEPKVTRGTVGGVSVQVSEETAERLGTDFEPEKTTARKATSSKTSK